MKFRCPSTSRCCIATTTSWSSTSRTFWPPCRGGSHVAQTALVRLRRELGLPELSPAHRLDRLTAGVLLFTTRRELRGAYQTLFARGLVSKTYLARAAVDPAVRAAAAWSEAASSSAAATCRLSASPECPTPRRWWSFYPLMACTG